MLFAQFLVFKDIISRIDIDFTTMFIYLFYNHRLLVLTLIYTTTWVHILFLLLKMFKIQTFLW